MKATVPILVCELTLIGIFFTSSEFAYGESDFYLEAEGNPSFPLKVTRLEIQGESYKQMCPSGHCIVDYGYTYDFTRPNPNAMYIAYNAEFRLVDNPQMKKFFTNLCDFYHEKTGIWAGMTNVQEYGTKYGKEFIQKYNSTIPESMIELISNSNQTKDN